MFDRQTEQNAVVTALHKAVDSPRICMASSLEDGTRSARCQVHAEQFRKGYTVQDSSYRVLRIKKG